MTIRTHTYELQCDRCKALFRPMPTEDTTIYRTRAAAKRNGWARRKVKVGEVQIRDHAELPDGRWVWLDTYHAMDDIANRDFCPKCIDEQEAQP